MADWLAGIDEIRTGDPKIFMAQPLKFRIGVKWLKFRSSLSYFNYVSQIILNYLIYITLLLRLTHKSTIPD